MRLQMMDRPRNRPAPAWAAASIVEPGQRVRLPSQPEWGEGQIQSVVGSRVTVNFEHAGKVLVNTAQVVLEVRLG